MIDLASTYATPLNVSTVIQDGIIDKFYMIDKLNRMAGLKTLKEQNYDLYIEIPQNYGLIKTLRNMLMVRFYLGVKSAFGWDAGWIKTFAKTQQLLSPPPKEVDRFLSTLSAHDIPSVISFPVKVEDTQKIQDLFLWAKGKKVVAFVVGTNVPANKWPSSSWCELAKKITKEDIAIVVVGGDQERELGEQIAKVSPWVKSVCGEFSLAQSGAALSGVDLAISHDTGAMHLAYAVRTPVISLFSTRQLSTKWHPYGTQHTVIEKYLPCSGCFKKVCDDNICMKNITVEEVYQSSKEVLR
jgi:ADP-heptose:LPS heptosyltransferase